MELERRMVLAAMIAGALPFDPALAKEAPSMTVDAPYAAVAMQLAARSVERAPDRGAARSQILGMIGEVETKIRSARIFIEQYGGHPVKLAVLPEYLFTSYPGRISIPDFAALAAFEMQGEEYEALGKVAQNLKLFLAGNAYEVDPNFPGLYFQASFLIAPSGDVVLRYRRLNSMFAPTPHDVWAKYLDVYGIDGVFPVARTEIGNMAAIASEEILYPEIARAHALRGAEIFLHSSSEIGSPIDTNKAIAKRARAFENLAYVVSANTAGIEGTGLPLASADGNSQIVDWKGRVVAESNSGETFTAFADIDLNALRTARRTPGMTNYLARQRLELFAAAYGTVRHPADGMLEGGAVKVPDRDYFKRVQEQVIERMIKEGLI
ncbi:MAG: nitrilase-related carbon-nitrogen hydrolase [Blastomonas fulva]|uniref:nitrilase-related carbon-nitrogen hydrolase n=1 Tax=Blastomonas TaxID=150203 RepID=UPI000856F5C8|nr:nitrilase-related carbon-nitrogen hydrolase [Blastomonas sp. RAC04]AOG00308.1 carbon-nitrogen hydrolase family protein [Blastomonas sp. RAC04]